jgi:hypothetical protein
MSRIGTARTSRMLQPSPIPSDLPRRSMQRWGQRSSHITVHLIGRTCSRSTGPPLIAFVWIVRHLEFTTECSEGFDQRANVTGVMLICVLTVPGRLFAQN